MRVPRFVPEASTLREAALSYHLLSMAVIPLHSVAAGICSCGCSDPTCNSRGKHPRIADWQHRRVRDKSQIRDWWNRWPDANIGVLTGATSDIIVLDVDPRNGGLESLAGIQLKNGPIPFTWEASTGGGGWHFYFKHPGFPVANSSGGLGRGLDLKGDGGYVVAPPSSHVSGRRYSWARQDDLAFPPAWLIDAFRRRPPRSARPPEEWVRLVVEGAVEGARNVTVASLAGHLLRHRVDPYVTLELVRVWNERRCRPPLDDEEIERVVDSIANAEARRLSRWRRA